MGFSDPGGADTSAPFTPATPGPGGGRGFLLAPSGASRFTAVADNLFRPPEGKKVRINSQYSGSGMKESSFGCGSGTEAKEVCVVVEPYGIPTTDSIPLNTRVGFSGEMKQD